MKVTSIKDLERRLEELEETSNGHKDKEKQARAYWRGLFRDVVTLIDEGVIVEREGKDRVNFGPLDALGGTSTPAWQILQDAQRFIQEAADQTGWRSPSAPLPHTGWQLYRANSLEDLRFWHRQLERWADEPEQP